MWIDVGLTEFFQKVKQMIIHWELIVENHEFEQKLKPSVD